MDNNDSVKRTATQAQQIVFDELDRLRLENEELKKNVDILDMHIQHRAKNESVLIDRIMQSDENASTSTMFMIYSIIGVAVLFSYVVYGFF